MASRELKKWEAEDMGYFVIRCFSPMAPLLTFDWNLDKHEKVPEICQCLTGTRGVAIPQHHMRGVTVAGFSTA